MKSMVCRENTIAFFNVGAEIEETPFLFCVKKDKLNLVLPKKKNLVTFSEF